MSAGIGGSALDPRGRRPGQRWSDHEVDQVIGRLLQAGVLIATVVVLIGSAMLLATHGSNVADYQVFRGVPAHLRTVGATTRAALAGDPEAIVQLGLILLIATPIARVVLTLVAFVLQRDALYVGLTALVLVVLLYGLM